LLGHLDVEDSGGGVLGAADVADDVAEELRAGDAHHRLGPLDAGAVLELELGAVELAGDARARAIVLRVDAGIRRHVLGVWASKQTRFVGSSRTVISPVFIGRPRWGHFGESA